MTEEEQFWLLTPSCAGPSGLGVCDHPLLWGWSCLGPWPFPLLHGQDGALTGLSKNIVIVVGEINQ